VTCEACTRLAFCFSRAVAALDLIGEWIMTAKASGTGKTTILAGMAFCVCLIGCRGKPSTGGDSPVTAARLTGTRLVDIRDNVSWDFDGEFVVIENKGQPLPPEVLATVVAGASTCQRVQAAWQLDQTNGMLLLSNILVDGKAVDQKTAISIKPAGHVRVNLGTRQYNMSRDKK